MTSDEDANVFEQGALWLADATLELALTGDDRYAAVSPGPAFPAVLRTLAAAVSVIGRQPVIVDLGAGIGGAGAWLAERAGAELISVEPAEGSRIAAKRLFPQLDIRAGSAQASGLPEHVADMVVALGVTSLLGELAGFLTEARSGRTPGAGNSVVGHLDSLCDG